MFAFKHQGDSIMLTILLIESDDMGIQFPKYQVSCFPKMSNHVCLTSIEWVPTREDLSLGFPTKT